MERTPIEPQSGGNLIEIRACADHDVRVPCRGLLEPRREPPVEAAKPFSLTREREQLPSTGMQPNDERKRASEGEHKTLCHPLRTLDHAGTERKPRDQASHRHGQPHPPPRLRWQPMGTAHVRQRMAMDDNARDLFAARVLSLDHRQRVDFDPLRRERLGQHIDVRPDSAPPRLGRKLRQRFEGKLSFRYTGPWPPYNFVTIRLQLERSAVV